MASGAPVIFSRGLTTRRMTVGQRLTAAGVALGCLTLLVIASRLTPSPDGFGSHTALGLPRCEFLARTGIPCPSCGMTTSWTWFVRGNLPASFYTQPMGALLAMMAAAAVWVGLYAALTGRPVYRLTRVVPSKYLYLPLLSFALLAWVWKIYIHLAGHEGFFR